MVAISQDHLAPFALVVVDRRDLAEVHAPVAKFAPGQVTQPVGPIVEALLKNLLVQTRPVEADRLSPLNIGLKLRVARRGPQAVRVKTLVEDKAQENRLVIQEELMALNMELAQPGVRLDPVHHRFPV